MREDIDRLLSRGDGVAPRGALLRHGIPRPALDHEVRRGLLVAPARATYCRPWDADDIRTRERATLMSLGRAAALSHRSALRRWDLPGAEPDVVHVSVPASRYPRGSAGLTVHRVARFPPVVRLDGLITVDAATAIVTSWPLLAPADRRAPAIEAVRRRIVTVGELGTAVDRHPRLSGRRALGQLIGLLAAGCESELEIWGCTGVFDVPGLRHAVRQRVVTVRGQRFRLDLAYEQEQVAIELDGRRWHSGVEQRERDLRRDAVLAAAGWLTLRLSYERLHSDVDGCRRDVLAALASRRRRAASG